MTSYNDEQFLKALDLLKKGDHQAAVSLNIQLDAPSASGRDIFIHELLSQSETAFQRLFNARRDHLSCNDRLHETLLLRSQNNGKRLLQRLIELGPEFLHSIGLNGPRLLAVVPQKCWLEPYMQPNGMPGSSHMINVARRCGVIGEEDYADFFLDLVKNGKDADASLEDALLKSQAPHHYGQSSNADVFSATSLNMLEEILMKVDGLQTAVIDVD